MKEVVLVFPHQLFEKSPCIEKGVHVFLVEDPLMFTQYAFHKQKLILHRASMKAYEVFLLHLGCTVTYVEYHELKETGDVALLLQKHSLTHVSFCDPVDEWLSKRLIKALTQNTISYKVYDSPMFLTNKEDLDRFFLPLLEQNKKFLMRSFYEWQRKRLGILVEQDGHPTGGRWSYDEDNRKKIPKGLVLPNEPVSVESLYITEAKLYVEQYFGSNPGSVERFFYPITHSDAKEWLQFFLKHKLAEFGPYEDAVTTEQNFLFHSILSPLINNGLLCPAYVIEETLTFAKTSTVPLSSLEGFIRQIIGWREYIRAVYVYHGTRIRTGNYFKAVQPLPSSFWSGTTGIAPVDDTIKHTLTYAYTHHIPRLMIMGNVMNLCGFHPHEVYKWFMELYIDAYDWVMVPNVYSMALYADGGLITTKPYISGSAYICKMSTYKKGEWSEIWDALFWNFIGKHYDLLSKEGRLGFIGITYSKMSQEKRDVYTRKASVYIESLYS